MEPYPLSCCNRILTDAPPDTDYHRPDCPGDWKAARAGIAPADWSEADDKWWRALGTGPTREVAIASMYAAQRHRARRITAAVN
jgi:hypothetical protein